MKFSKGQLAYLLCTIYQSTKDGRVTTEKPEGDFVYIKTPEHGPDIDGAERPADVPEGAQFWYESYMNGTLQNGYGYGMNPPQLPTFEGSSQFKILQEFIAKEDAAPSADAQ